MNRLERGVLEPDRYHQVSHNRIAIKRLLVGSSWKRCWQQSCACQHRCGRWLVEEVSRNVGQIRKRWPKVRVRLRADGGFARDDLMTWCEANGVQFAFGLPKAMG